VVGVLPRHPRCRRRPGAADARAYADAESVQVHAVVTTAAEAELFLAEPAAVDASAVLPYIAAGQHATGDAVRPAEVDDSTTERAAEQLTAFHGRVVEHLGGSVRRCVDVRGPERLRVLAGHVRALGNS
jgi:hypothetical protein